MKSKFLMIIPILLAFAFMMPVHATWETGYEHCRNVDITETSSIATTDNVLIFTMTGLDEKLENNRDVLLVDDVCGGSGSPIAYNVIDNTSTEVTVEVKASLGSSEVKNWAVYYENPIADVVYPLISSYQDGFEYPYDNGGGSCNYGINTTFWGIQTNSGIQCDSMQSTTYRHFGDYSLREIIGDSEYFQLHHSFSPTEIGTVRVWFREDGNATNHENAQRVYIDDGSQYGQAYSIEKHLGTSATNYAYMNQGNRVASSIPFKSEGAWVLSTIVTNGTDIKLYIDSEKILEQAQLGNHWDWFLSLNTYASVIYYDQAEFFKDIFINPEQNYTASIGIEQSNVPEEINYNLTNCEQINDSGEYQLMNNITDSAFGQCFVINTNNVEIDCNGYTIDGIDSGTSVGIDVESFDNITIQHCIVKDWGYALYLSDITGITMIDNELYSNARNGILMDTVNNPFLLDSRLHNNNDADIDMTNVDNFYVNANVFHDSSTMFQVDDISNSLFFKNMFNTTSDWLQGTLGNHNDWNNTAGGNYWANSAGTGFSDVCNATVLNFCTTDFTLESDNVDYQPISYNYVAPAIPVTGLITGTAGFLGGLVILLMLFAGGLLTTKYTKGKTFKTDEIMNIVIIMVILFTTAGLLFHLIA